jgi:hypothetical protein
MPSAPLRFVFAPAKQRAYSFCALLMIALNGCGTPSEEEQMQEGQDALVAEAVALQRCFSANGDSAEQCAGRRKAYDSALAAFGAKYGNSNRAAELSAPRVQGNDSDRPGISGMAGRTASSNWPRRE